MTYNYLLTLCLILVSTKLFSLATGKMQMPQVVGALLAGLILGPGVLGSLTQALFGMQVCLQPSDLLNQLAELGVIVIMFSAGMGTSINDLKSSGKAGFLVALIGVLVPLGMGTLLMRIFNPGGNILSAVFMGTVLTATSVSITVETLKELGKLSTKVGNTILAAALIDDILGLICLTIVTSLAGATVNIALVLLKIVLFFVFVGIVGVLFYRFMVWYDRRVKDQNLHRFPIAAFALCLFMAWAAESLFGVADIIGAFSAGMIVAMTPKGQYISGKFSPLSYLLLTPIFFANIGLKVTLPKMNATFLLFTVLLVAVGILSKLIGCGLGAKLCGFSNRQCLQTGFGMACRGEVALIVANKGMAMNMVESEYFGPIIILVICCAVFTPILLKAAFKGEGAYEGLQSSQLVDNYEASNQVDIVTDRLLRHNQEKQKPNNADKH
ncbi:MAG: cation:proton antiporter [Faecalibacterium sp.]|nr:cation:proton antiporter [Faecalibacterium sp.]